MRSRLFSFFLFCLLVACLVLGNVSSVGAVSGSHHFWGYEQFTVDENTFDDPMPYGFFINMFSTLDVPTSWYLQYTMSFYLMNSSGYGYYIGFHQYRGDGRIYLAPVANGNMYGLDGSINGIPAQYQVGSLFGCDVRIDYNDTSGRFSIVANGLVLANNTFSGLTLTDYNVKNPLGREGIAGNVLFYYAGYDTVNHTYNVAMTNGIEFKVFSDGIESDEGGYVNWTSASSLGANQQSGTSGFYDVFGLFDSLSLEGTANDGYEFSSHFVQNAFTGEFCPAGYYDRGGRLIVSHDFRHLYAEEDGVVEVTYDYLNDNRELYYWHNATGQFAIFLVDQDTYAEASYFADLVVLAFSSRNPNFAGVRTNNPFVYQYSGSNVTLITHFVSVNFSPYMVEHLRPDVDGNGIPDDGEGTGTDDDDDGLYDPNKFSGSIEDFERTIEFFFVLLLIFAPPMTLLVLAPKVGMGGFFGVLAITAGVGVLYFGLPLYCLLLVALGVGLMFFSMFKKV